VEADTAPADPVEAPAIDARLVRKIADILKDTGLSEIEVEHAGLKIRVARELTAAPVNYVQAAAPAYAPAPVAAPAKAVPAQRNLAVGATPESVTKGFGGKYFVTLMGASRKAGDGDGKIVKVDGDKVTVLTEGLDDPKGIVFVAIGWKAVGATLVFVGAGFAVLVTMFSISELLRASSSGIVLMSMA
jgi:biotin carboxyl carrier protein